MVVAVDRRSEQIRILLEEAGVSIRAFARMIGIPDHQKVSNWLKGENRPRDESVWDDMIRVAEREHHKRVGIMRPRAMDMKPIKVVGLVAAGDGAMNVDTEFGEVLVPANLAGPDHLGWTVDGDSMMPALEPGDIAVFKEETHPSSKFAYLVKTREGLRCKRLQWSLNDGKWLMESLNPAYPPEDMSNAQLLGKLIGYYRVRGLHEKFEADPGGLRLD